MSNKLLKEELTDIKYLFRYKSGKVISEQSISFMKKKQPERLVKDIETGKIVGTYTKGVGFFPTPKGKKMGYEYGSLSIPMGTIFGGIEIDDFEYENDDF